MDEFMMTLTVAALFLIRIGIPVALLVTVGVLVDRWQRNHHDEQHQAH
jgi:hypothetical protein